MTPFDYITDVLLIAVVVLQMRTRTLTLRSLLLPIGLVAGAGIAYLRPISLAGNNLVLIAVLLAAGVSLGTLSGLATSVWRRDDGDVVSRAGTLAAFLWVLGMGARFAFAIYATHSGAASVARFSFKHQITGAHIWEFALVLMAYGEVLSRVTVLQLRAHRARRAGRRSSTRVPAAPTPVDTPKRFATVGGVSEDLHAHLLEERGDEVAKLHRRASAWFGANGDTSQAVIGTTESARLPDQDGDSSAQARAFETRATRSVRLG